MNPVRYAVGDRVRIDDPAFRNIENGNKSVLVHPCSSFVEIARRIHAAGTIGVVTHTFPPGYEMTVDFDGQAMHMKDHWVSRA